MELKGIDVFSGESVRIEIVDASIHKVEKIEKQGSLPYVAPGFIDMQVNGFRGSDYSAEDFSEDQLRKIIDDLATSGTTQHLPTIITSPKDRIVRNLSVIAESVSNSEDLRAAIVGIHLEGPYISSEDGPRGAHDLQFVRNPDLTEFEEWQKAADGHISMVTLAPEREGALEFIRKVTETGVRVAIGHTAADPEIIHEAVHAGATLSTHLGNGSHGRIPRLRNYIWEQLAEDGLMASIIADSFHLPKSVTKVIQRAKGLGRIILISDVAVMAGKEPGIYEWGNISVQVFADGHLGLAGTEYLAGAAHLLDWDIVHFMKFTGCSIGKAVSACTRNPARYFDLPSNFAHLEPGAPAHLVIFQFETDASRLNISKTIRNGKIVFSP